MHAICLVQGGYRQLWGRTDGSLNTGTWLKEEGQQGSGKPCSQPQTFPALLQETVQKEFSSLHALPTHTGKKKSMVYGMMGWQNFSHALVGDHEKKKTTGKQERMQNYQLWVPRVPVAPWQVPELGKQSSKNTGYTTEWDPKESNIVTKGRSCTQTVLLFLNVISLLLFPFTFSLSLSHTSAALGMY